MSVAAKWGIALLAFVVISAALVCAGLWVHRLRRESAFIYEAVDSGDVGKIRALLNDGVYVDARGMWNETALIHAACKHQTEAVRYLLRSGADVNAQDEDGHSALLWALLASSTDQPKEWTKAIRTVRVLLHAGARIDLTSTEGYSPIQWAKLRNSKLKQNPNFYAPFRERGLADPTRTMRSLAGMVLAHTSK